MEGDKRIGQHNERMRKAFKDLVGVPIATKLLWPSSLPFAVSEKYKNNNNNNNKTIF